jgi:replicative DNA helicase
LPARCFTSRPTDPTKRRERSDGWSTTPTGKRWTNFDVGREPERLLEFCREREAADLFVDSLKDVAADLSRDETGSRVNRAAQLVVASGIELVSLHHQRKSGTENRKPDGIDDVYGSVWLVSGAGSVALLWGKPGDPVIEFSQLKMPAAPVGPFTVTVDHDTGTIGVADGEGPLAILRSSPRGLTAVGLARIMYGTDDVSNPDREKARRKLESLVRDGLAHRRVGSGRADHAATTYFALVDDDPGASA